jgi:hypothetical protein
VSALAPTRGPVLRRDRWALAAAALTAAATLLVVSAYLVRAGALVTYPWDWSPDEGLYLDYGRRVLADPGSLYPRGTVPYPAAYGPLLPVLLAPFVGLPHPLAAARLLAIAWAAAGAAGIGLLVRQRAGPAWAAASVALYLAPFDLSFWHALVRVDGPMIALWLWAAVALLPRGLARGADALSGGRVAAGAALLLAATLVKPTAAVHGAPLVLGWFLIDRRSAWRLAGTMAVVGAAAVAALEVATGGGYLRAMGLWALHPAVRGLPASILARFVTLAWPVLVLALGVGLAARAAGGRPERDPAVLLLAGGLAIAPLMGKQGAAWNYLLPLYAATVVATGAWAAALRARAAVAAGAALLALALAASRPFPLPTAVDETTAAFFYGFIQDVERRTGGPILATRPDLVYFVVGQPAEVDGGNFLHLAAGGAPGTESVLRGLEERRYALVVWTWPLPDSPRWTDALLRGYARVGACRLGWYFGAPFPSHLAVRRGLAVPFAPPAGTRCAASGKDTSTLE